MIKTGKNQVHFIIIVLIVFIFCLSDIIYASYYSEQDNNYLEQVKEASLRDPTIKKYLENHPKYDFRFEYDPADLTDVQLYQIDKKNNRALRLLIFYDNFENTAHFRVPDNTTFTDCLKAFEIALKYIKQGKGFYVYDISYNFYKNKQKHVIYYNIFSDSDLDNIIATSDFYKIDINTGKIFEDHSEP